MLSFEQNAWRDIESTILYTEGLDVIQRNCETP